MRNSTLVQELGVNRYPDQVIEACSRWREDWREQLGPHGGRQLVDAIDDLADFHARASTSRGQRSDRGPSPSEILWLATTPDPVFRHVLGQYLESLLVDPEWGLERVDRQMATISRARTAARRELGPILDGSAVQMP